jgi:hypothetical protein
MKLKFLLVIFFRENGVNVKIKILREKATSFFLETQWRGRHNFLFIPFRIDYTGKENEGMNYEKFSQIKFHRKGASKKLEYSKIKYGIHEDSAKIPYFMLFSTLISQAFWVIFVWFSLYLIDKLALYLKKYTTYVLFIKSLNKKPVSCKRQ